MDNKTNPVKIDLELLRVDKYYILYTIICLV